MSGQRYNPEFEDESVKLITERGYSVESGFIRISMG